MLTIPLDTTIPIKVEDKSIKFTYSSFSRGYHAYMNSWNPIVGDDSLICEREDNNEHDEHAVAVMYHDSISWKVVGHVPLHLSQVMSNFLRFPNCSIRVTITGKRVNRGVCLGLEIPIHYIFYGDERVIAWVEKAIKKVNDNIAINVSTNV